ncbi:protein ACCELERATED CELL DEATH 6 isoform X1 [Setaria viridis]|nr:serine/threonine-protein phosphatase 6 regulatory ankyrin repeat subunit B-like isoform X1 [Setaria viridis]
MAGALAAPVEFVPDQMMLSPELLQVLTAGNAARLMEVLSSEGQTNGDVAIDVQPAAPTAVAPPGQATSSSCLLGVTSNGNTALHLAASRGHAELAALLCEKAPSLVATRNRDLDTPLHCAAKAGHREVAACLLSAMRAGGEEAAAALRARNCLGATALYEAVRHRSVVLVDLLMTEAPELSSLAAEDGLSPLYLATSIGSLQMVRRIVRPSLDGTPSPASYSGPKGRTALHSAVFVFREIAQEMTREILKWEPEGPALLTKVDSSGRTPLHLAIIYEQLDVIGLLLDVPTSDKQARTSDHRGLFPIHTAAMVGSTRIIDKLVEKCPDYCEMVDDQGRNFLHCAIEHNQETVVRHICQNYTSAVLLNAMDYDGNTPFHLAVKYIFPRIVTLLLQTVIVEIGVTNKDGLTARDLGLRGLVRGRLYFPLDPLWIVVHCLRWSGASVADPYLLVDNVPTGAEEETSHEDYDTKSGTIGSVLIATVAFAAAFTVPGGFVADDHPNAGTAILARRFAFRAFVVSDTMAFVCSVVATSFLIFGGAREIPRNRRRTYNRAAPLLVSMGAVSMITAFAFGFDLVLGNANRGLVVFVYLACLFTVVQSSGVWFATDPVGLVTAVHRRAGWRGLFNVHQRPSGLREWFLLGPSLGSLEHI